MNTITVLRTDTAPYKRFRSVTAHTNNGACVAIGGASSIKAVVDGRFVKTGKFGATCWLRHEGPNRGLIRRDDFKSMKAASAWLVEVQAAEIEKRALAQAANWELRKRLSAAQDGVVKNTPGAAEELIAAVRAMADFEANPDNKV